MEQQKVEIVAACAEYFKQSLAFNETLFMIAKWAFILALALAVLNAIADLIIKMRAPAGQMEAMQAGEGDENPSEILKAITSLIDSLAKAPVWFFLFVAGLTLIYVSTVDVPEICANQFRC